MSLPGFVETASRLNFCIIRPILQMFYGIIIGLVMMIFINCFTVVVAGKRFKAHYDFVTRVAKWIGHLYMYFLAATDDIPDLFPK